MKAHLRGMGAALALLLAAGCSSPSTAPTDPAEATTHPAPTPASSASTPEVPAASEPATEDPAEDLGIIDALAAQGPVAAETVPDMTPLITDAVPALPATVTDATGATVTVTSADSVLSLDLYGTLTDTIIGLGLQDRLVGRSGTDTQASIADLPVVSKDGIDLNVEAVLGLRPDLILTNMTIGSAASYDQLESAGVTVVRFAETPHLAAIPEAITMVGDTFGVGDAATELANHTTQELVRVAARIDQLTAQTPVRPRAAVLYVRGTGGIFFILGADYGAADILEALQLEDVALSNGITNLKPANAESLVALDPEIILTMEHGIASSGGIEGFLERPGVSATTAGSNERIITAADSQLLSYGPRTPANLLALAEAIYTQ